ncbi:MAG: PAS domain-containing protein [Promethearchaeota archaeon]
MSEEKINEEFTTQLNSEQFLYFVDNSNLGIVIIQRGYLLYYNKQFGEIFGYSQEEISQWKKREFYKIVHPEDLKHLVEKFKIEKDNKTIIIRFRGVKKDKSIINIENYNYQIKYNNKFAVLSYYNLLEGTFKEEIYAPKTITIKKEKIIMLKYHPYIENLLKSNNLKYEIYNYSSFQEENQIQS